MAAVVEAEVKELDAALARVANNQALINKLPEQVLGDIFEWCCLSVDPVVFGEDTGLSEYFSNRERARIDLLGICHWWFVVLTNRVSIWKHIYLTLSHSHQETVIRLRLERVRAASITISVNLVDERAPNNEEPPNDSSYLSPALLRCESLHVNYNSIINETHLAPLPLPSQIPNLASLTIRWKKDRGLWEMDPPAIFPSGAMYPHLRELSLRVVTDIFHASANTYTDLFGLTTINASMITSLVVDFDSLPDGTWSVLEHFDALSKLALCRNMVYRDRGPHASSGVTSRAITLKSLRLALIEDIPQFSSLIRLKVPCLEELTTDGPMDSIQIVDKEAVEESLIHGLFSLNPPSTLMTLRIELRSHYITKKHWENFFASQQRLEILQCPCSDALVGQIPSVPQAFPRLRLLHLDAYKAFDGLGEDPASPNDIQSLGNGLKTLQSHVSTELLGNAPGLRVLVQLPAKSDRLLIPDIFLQSRFRFVPHDQPWISHPAWD